MSYKEMHLDPGIANVVALLQQRGFETCDSGDGVSKPASWYEPDERGVTEAISYPHVVFRIEKKKMLAEATRALRLLRETYPTENWQVEATFYENSGAASVMCSRPNLYRPPAQTGRALALNAAMTALEALQAGGFYLHDATGVVLGSERCLAAITTALDAAMASAAPKPATQP